MLKGWGGDVTYAEGFAGPGVYTKGEPGSPVIAFRALFEDRSLGQWVKTARLLFVDADRRCTSMLVEKLEGACPPDWSIERLRTRGVDVDVVSGRCEPELPRLLSRHGAWGHPILMVLDTFGAAVSADLLRQVAGNPGSEVIVTIKPQYFARFAAAQDMDHGDRVFGGEGWRAVADQPSAQKTNWLLTQYRETVKAAGFTHILDFELVDDSGHSLYLVFGTTHERGVQKMKEAMWEVDIVHGMGYRDPRDPAQQTLEIQVEPHTAPLRRLLLAHLATKPGNRATLRDLRTYTLYETVFKESQARQVVLDLLQEGKLVQADDHGRLQFDSTVHLAHVG
jgi:three-Cys-motif partner protein